MITYVLINCTPGQEKEIISELSKMPEIIEVNGIMGKYDIFVKISASIPGQIDLVIHKIRSLGGVTGSYSMTALYGQGGTIDDESSRPSMLDY